MESEIDESVPLISQYIEYVVFICLAYVTVYTFYTYYYQSLANKIKRLISRQRYQKIINESDP